MINMKNKNLEILVIIPGRGGSKGIAIKKILKEGKLTMIAQT